MATLKPDNVCWSCHFDKHDNCKNKWMPNRVWDCVCCPVEESSVSTTIESVMTNTCILCKIPLCDTCGCCENEACLIEGKAITTVGQLASIKHLLARTQKARGYALIAESLHVPKPFRIITEEADVESVTASGKLFARPCPVRPRHGFVESRPLTKQYGQGTSMMDVRNEIKSILIEAKAADPEAELLIVPAIDASHNVILTPTRMAVGTGNDGATAGRKSVVFPLAGVPFGNLPESLIRKAGVGEDEDPYVEAVLVEAARDAYARQPDDTNTTEAIFFTQLRAGAKIDSCSPNYVPEEMTVEKVVEASGDLLEWERQVQEDIKPGTVVVHVGGTLISHYGVHCILNKIPILTTYVPKIGERLIPTPKMLPLDPEAVIEGLGIAASSQYIGLDLTHDHGCDIDGPWPVKLYAHQATSLLLVAAHNAMAMTGTDGKWLGIAAVLMMRLGMAASHGEARHKTATGHASGHDRGYVYKCALNDFFNAREALGCAQWRFQTLKWDGAFGGPKWAACTESIIRLDQAARSLIKARTTEAVNELIAALHSAINQAHNGGWWLNKFVTPQVFDDSCVQNMTVLCAAAPSILDISQIPITASVVQSTVDRWAKCDEPKVQEVLPKVELEVIDPCEQPKVPYVAELYTAGIGIGGYGSTIGGISAGPDEADDKCGDENCSTCYPQEQEDEPEVIDENEATPEEPDVYTQLLDILAKTKAQAQTDKAKAELDKALAAMLEPVL